MTTYTISLIGFGGVNRALAELISTRNDQWQKDLGFSLNIVGVSDLHLGSVISPNGINARMLTETKFDKGGFADLSGGSADPRTLEVIKTAPSDIVAEATFTDPETGQPAISYCQAALEAGRSLITTNKGPIAHATSELAAIAKQNGVGFEYEGAVMSGTPVIRLAHKVLAGSEITGFQGIMNGTSNYMLGRMQDGLGFDEAVVEAQNKGYAEADPTADVEGLDVRLKVVILANELLGTNLKPTEVACSGISALTSADLEEAAKAGESWKLIGSAKRNDVGAVEASVEAVRLPLSHPLASVSGATNAVTFSTNMLGNLTITGPGAGRIETAYALVSDIIALHQSQDIKPVMEAAE